MSTVIPYLPGASSGPVEGEASATAYANWLALRMTANGTVKAGIASRGDLSATARPPKEGQMTVAALDALIPVPYGQVYAGALLANVFTLNGMWVFWLIWGEGPIDSIVDVYLDDAALPSGSSAANYLGSATGDVDATLTACFAAQGIAYAEALPYLAYSVVQVPYQSVTAAPRFNAVLRGIKIARLSETQRNLLARSNDFAASPWANVSSPGFGVLVADPVGNLTAQPIEDDGAAAIEGRSQAITVAADTESYVASIYVKKTTSSVPTFGIDFAFASGNSVGVRLKTDTGAVQATSGTATVVDCGTYWRLITPAIANTNKTTLTLSVYPCACPAGSFSDNVTATGTATVCWAQVEKASAATDYQPIATTYAADSTPGWTNCPALILRDFLESTRWGAGRTVLSHGVENVLQANNTVFGSVPNTEAARTCDLMLDRDAGLDAWIETLRTAAACFLVETQGTVKLVPDTDSTPLATYDHASGQIMALAEPELRSPQNLPTVIEITYTDTSALPWRDATTDAVKRPGVDAGTTPYRKSVVEMRWITRASQAAREAAERMNKLWLRSIGFRLQLFDEALKREPGDLIYVTYPDAGFNALPARVLACQPNAMGWALAVEKHDPGAYSTTVLAGPTNPNTDLPLPTDPPTMGAITVTEDVYLVQAGRYNSRLYITWTPAEWPFLSHYAVTVTQAGTIKETGTATRADAAYTSKPLAEDLQYVVSVAIVSSTGALGTAATATITTSGKSALPSDVPSLQVVEISGEVRLTWEPATDRDLTGYEIRYGSTASSWSTATLLDRIAAPALRYSTRQIGAGHVRVFIKALDSVRSDAYPYGQESANAIYQDVTVTTDAMAFVAASEAFAGPPDLRNMVAVGSTWVTSFGQTWNALFTAAMNTYTDPIYTYHTAGTSGLWSDIVDLGLELTGDFRSTLTYTELDGVDATEVLQLVTGGEATLTVDDATNATPIVCRTTAAHDYNTGDEVVIAGVGGNTAANGRWLITVTDSTHFSLQTFGGADVAGSGAFTTNGTASRWPWVDYPQDSVRTTARYARQKISTTGTLVVTDLGSVAVNVLAQPDSGQVTIDSATEPNVVSFNKWFTQLASLVLTPASGSAARMATYDQVEVSRGHGLQSGRYLRFDGSSQYVSRNSIAVGNAITVECWVKPDGWTLTGAAQQIWGMQTDAWTTRPGLQVNSTGVKIVLAEQAGSTNYFADATTGAWTVPPVAGQWTHVAVVWTAAAVAILYYNGVEVGRAQTTYDPTCTSTARTWSVGRTANGFAYYQGCVDAYRVWNAARTPAEILANYDQRLTTGTNLILNWNFDETTGSSAADDSGNAYTGTVGGYTNRRMWRPYDGFDAYLFNDAGAQQSSGLVSWYAQGI